MCVLSFLSYASIELSLIVPAKWHKGHYLRGHLVAPVIGARQVGLNPTGWPPAGCLSQPSSLALWMVSESSEPLLWSLLALQTPVKCTAC